MPSAKDTHNLLGLQLLGRQSGLLPSPANPRNKGGRYTTQGSGRRITDDAAAHHGDGSAQDGEYEAEAICVRLQRCGMCGNKDRYEGSEWQNR